MAEICVNMAESLRKLPLNDVIRHSISLDVEYARMIRRERTLVEKDQRNGAFPLEPQAVEALSGADYDYEKNVLFWDVLRDETRETALFLVLRWCLGYSAVEIAAGLGVPYSRVKDSSSKARRRWQARTN